jgi:predicted HAD superfamily phosphohydrolase YqeG
MQDIVNKLDKSLKSDNLTDEIRYYFALAKSKKLDAVVEANNREKRVRERERKKQKEVSGWLKKELEMAVKKNRLRESSKDKQQSVLENINERNQAKNRYLTCCT